MNHRFGTILFLSLFINSVSAAGAETPVYLRTDRPVEERVEDLLSRMTLQEKIGQLNQRSYWYSEEGKRVFYPMVENGEVGSLMNVTDPETANALQRIAVEKSRLGIPLLLARDVIHGYKTIFPIPLGQAATFSPEVVREGSRIAAVEASSDGIRWTFAPMVDIARDARWGRIAEGFGEDPYLTSVMSAASVEGFQHGDSIGSPTSVAACAKHFVAYGAAEGGRDYNTTGVSARELRQTYLPPFKAAADAGALTFMASFNANDGIPSSANAPLLTGVLREEWKFPGFVVSDCFSVRELVSHRVAADEKEAAAMSVAAGLDMDMEDSIFATYLPALVAEGKVDEKDIDRGVRGILRAKFMLGLFEDPYVHTPQDVKYSPAHLEAARKAASESVILLKNESSTLPLSPKRTKKILLTGPMADASYNQLGTWIFDGEREHTVTILDALRGADFSGFKVDYTPGLLTPRRSDAEEIERAVRGARSADAVVVAVGEDAILSGEGHCMADIELVGAQSELVARLKETGKPIILIVMAGRPLAIGREVELADAVLWVFHPGTMGGPAIADILTGKVNPSGKTPVTFPTTSGQCPIYYNHQVTGRPATGKELKLGDIPDDAGNTFLGCTSYYLDAGHEPLYPFGYGLSYTNFDYSDLKIGEESYSPDGVVTATFTLTNTGDREGTETVQLYTTDLVASVAPNVADLRSFRRVTLAPGESRRVTLEFPVEALSITGTDLIRRVEPGEFILRVGPDSLRGIEGKFEVKNEK